MGLGPEGKERSAPIGGRFSNIDIVPTDKEDAVFHLAFTDMLYSLTCLTRPDQTVIVVYPIGFSREPAKGILCMTSPVMVRDRGFNFAWELSQKWKEKVGSPELGVVENITNTQNEGALEFVNPDGTLQQEEDYIERAKEYERLKRGGVEIPVCDFRERIREIVSFTN